MLNYFLRSLIDFVFRRRSVGASLIKVGVPLYALVLASLSIGITIPMKDGPLVFSWDTSGGSAGLSWSVFGVATIIVATGLYLVIRDVRRENRQKVIVIEARGLRDWQGEPLERAVPPSIPGRRDAVVVDVRQGLIDGQIVAPERALQKLASLPDDIARRTDGTDRSDISFVLGGLAPVPFLFLLGVIVDDEHRTTIMDWDRNRHIWRLLDNEDDGKSFDVTGLDKIGSRPGRVCLCVSASYDVLEDNVRMIDPTSPIIRMDLPDRSPVSHLSEDKQRRLAQQFLETVIALEAKGVGEIALFLAAPASLSLRLGTVYDRRNLPQLAVNQFEKSDPKKFPWAVWMPVAGTKKAILESR